MKISYAVIPMACDRLNSSARSHRCILSSFYTISRSRGGYRHRGVCHDNSSFVKPVRSFRITPPPFHSSPPLALSPPPLAPSSTASHSSVSPSSPTRTYTLEARPPPSRIVRRPPIANPPRTVHLASSDNGAVVAAVAPISVDARSGLLPSPSLASSSVSRASSDRKTNGPVAEFQIVDKQILTRAHAPVRRSLGITQHEPHVGQEGEFVRTSEIHGCPRASADSGAAPRARARGDVRRRSTNGRRARRGARRDATADMTDATDDGSVALARLARARVDVAARVERWGRDGALFTFHFSLFALAAAKRGYDTLDESRVVERDARDGRRRA